MKIRKAIPDKTLFIGYNEIYCVWHIINSRFTFSDCHICYFALHFHFHFTPLAGNNHFWRSKICTKRKSCSFTLADKKVYFYFLLIFEPLYKILPLLCVARRPYNRNSSLPWGTMESCSCLTLPTALWTMQEKKNMFSHNVIQCNTTNVKVYTELSRLLCGKVDKDWTLSAPGR